MGTLRFAMFGADFRALFHIATWKELAAVESGAIYVNRNRSKEEYFATGFGAAAVYDDPEEVLRREQPDFIDTVTYPFTFSPLLS
jgi:predicted dehydrogenase